MKRLLIYLVCAAMFGGVFSRRPSGDAFGRSNSFRGRRLCRNEQSFGSSVGNRITGRKSCRTFRLFDADRR